MKNFKKEFLELSAYENTPLSDIYNVANCERSFDLTHYMLSKIIPIH